MLWKRGYVLGLQLCALGVVALLTSLMITENALQLVSVSRMS